MVTRDVSAAKVTSKYAAGDIHVLGGREAVRRRPSMYIGSTDLRGLQHLVYEITYNSIDEAMAGYCTKIVVTLQADGAVRVEDDGRGIPVEIHPVTNKSALETVMTTLHAGAKFDGHTYQVSGGLHGVGASVVNALSAWCKVSVRRDGKLYEQEYRQGIPQKDVTEAGQASGTGTTTIFLADEEIFGKAHYNFDTLCERFREMAYLNRGLEITLRDERRDSEKTFYFEGGITSFVRQINRNRAVRHRQPIFIAKTLNGTITETALQYNDGFTESILSFANCVNTTDGGSHVTGFRTALTRVLNDHARKNKFLKEDDPNLTGEDVREGLTAVVSVKLAEPQFEGQTKSKLGNPEVKGTVESAIGEGLSLYLEEHPDDLKRIIEKCLLAAKAREAARKARDLIVKKSGLFSGTLPGKLADCSEKEPSLCELYLVEGESAGGSAKQGRNRRFQAILPLRGKVLNVEKAPADKMLSHSEIRAIITALGTGIDDELDLSRLRYHHVILMTDADVDGSHIRTLLLTFFFRHMAELIQQGHLFIAQPPLYRVTKGKTEDWLYTQDELERLPFRELSARSTDGALTASGAELFDLLGALKEVGDGFARLESQGIPGDICQILLGKEDTLRYLALEDRESLPRASAWFGELLNLPVKSHSDPEKNEHWLEIESPEGNIRLDKQLFADPRIQQCLAAYPQVAGLVAKERYVILKKDKEIGSDIPWNHLARELRKNTDKTGMTIQRYKGLGEMTAEQLWETTMNPDTRTLLSVNVEDAARADHIFHTLMGDEVPPRKAFIQAHAKSVTNLDI